VNWNGQAPVALGLLTSGSNTGCRRTYRAEVLVDKGESWRFLNISRNLLAAVQEYVFLFQLIPIVMSPIIVLYNHSKDDHEMMHRAEESQIWP